MSKENLYAFLRELEQTGTKVPTLYQIKSGDNGKLQVGDHPIVLPDGDLSTGLLSVRPTLPKGGLGALLVAPTPEGGLSSYAALSCTSASLQACPTGEKVVASPDSQITWLLRRCVNLPSGAMVDEEDLRTRLAVIWQLSHLAAFEKEAGIYSMGELWGSFSLPGFTPESLARVREDWWWIKGMTMVEFAASIRDALACGRPLPSGLFHPYNMTAGMAFWLDDSLLLKLMETALPQPLHLTSTVEQTLSVNLAEEFSLWAKRYTKRKKVQCQRTKTLCSR